MHGKMFTLNLFVLLIIACAAKAYEDGDDILAKSRLLDDLTAEQSSLDPDLQEESAQTITKIIQDDHTAEATGDQSTQDFMTKALLQSWTNETGLMVTVQASKLSIVTRYAGTGYDLLKGNPEGDFNRGGIDPGIRKTREIFSHSYKSRKKVFYRGKRMKVPDQVSFHMSQSCAASRSVSAYSGRKSYMNELKTSVGVSGK